MFHQRASKYLGVLRPVLLPANLSNKWLVAATIWHTSKLKVVMKVWKSFTLKAFISSSLRVPSLSSSTFFLLCLLLLFCLLFSFLCLFVVALLCLLLLPCCFLVGVVGVFCLLLLLLFCLFVCAQKLELFDQVWMMFWYVTNNSPKSREWPLTWTRNAGEIIIQKHIS